MPSRRLAAIVTVVLVLAFVVVAVAPAFALPTHSRLVGSTPTDGSTVGTAATVVLEFNEEVNPDFVAVRVTGPDGAKGAEADGTPVVDGRTVTQALADALPAGAHTVTYRVVSADGHPISGSLTFTTTAPPATSAPSQTASTTPPASAGATAGPSPLATAPATPDTQDASQPSAADDDSGSTPWLVVAVAAGLVALLLLVARRASGRRGGGHDADPDGAARA